MSIAGGIGAAVRLPTPDARFGVEVQAARSPGRTRFRRGAYASTALTDVATVTRATQAWGVDQGGNVSAFAAGQPVVTTAGLAVYEARTNYIRNPTGLGAVAGTPGTPPTNWNLPSPVNGLARQVVGFGTTSSGLPYVDIRYSGTTTASSFISNPFEVAGVVTASQGQTWTHSCYMALVGGSLANLTDASLRIAQHGTAGAYLGEVTGTPPSLMGLTANLTKVTVSGVADNASVISVSPYWQIYYPNGVAVDFTLRFAAPNLKLGADINDPPILQTNNAAATRNADVNVETVNIPPGRDFTVQGVTTAPNNAANIWPTVFELRDAANQNKLTVHFDGPSGDLYAVATSGGSIANYTGGAHDATRSPGTLVRFALSVTSSSIKWSVNGGAVKTLPALENGPFQAALTLLGLGCRVAGGNQLNSALRDLSITMRAFSDAELQTASDVSLTHDIDFVSQVYQYVGAPYVTPTDLPGTTFTRSTAAYGDDTAGNLILFPSGVPRITNKGVLIGEARTNVLLQSTTLSNFGVSNATNTTDGTLSLTGNLARKITSLTAAAILFNYNIAGGAAAGANTVSVYAKRGSGSTDANTFALRNSTMNTVLVAVAINYDTGVFNYTAGSSGAVVTPMANGWWRISLTSSSFSAGDGLQLYAAFQGNSEGAGEYAYLADAQGEAGSFASPYIPTTSASATCNADVLASVNDNSPAAYTVAAEFTVPATGPTTGLVWQWDDGTANNKSLLYYNRSTGRLYCQVYAGGVIQANLDLGAVTAGNSYNVALRVAANDFAASLGGAAVVTDTSGTVPTTSVFRFGADIPGAGGMWSGYIKRIRRYSVGKTNAELQALAA